MPAQLIGYADELRSRRRSVMAIAPASARRAIMGWPRVWRPEKTHRIEIDLRTGSRVITQEVPPPIPVVLIEKPPRRIWKAKRSVDGTVMPPDVVRVLDAVADAFGVSDGLIQGRGHNTLHTYPRFAWVALLKADGRSYASIGRAIRRDHTSIMHACNRAADLMAKSTDWRHRYEAAHIALNGGVC